MTKKKVEKVIQAVLDKVDEERSQAQEPVPTPSTPVTNTAYPVSPVMYCLFINDGSQPVPGKKDQIIGTWYCQFLDTRTPHTCHGPYIMYNKQGLPFVGFVDIEVLKALARDMVSHLTDFQEVPLVITNRGCVFMSTLVYIAKK